METVTETETKTKNEKFDFYNPDAVICFFFGFRLVVILRTSNTVLKDDSYLFKGIRRLSSDWFRISSQRSSTLI